MVTCICPTFGRAPAKLNLLEECVYWFGRQTYTAAELLIYNDAVNQTLICNAPGVRVINTANRCPTLGDKYNDMVEASRGSIILPWEDDDISLPNRIQQAVDKLQGADYFNPRRTWYEQGGELHHKHTHGVCHNGSAYHKDFLKIVGGYDRTSGNQDMLIQQRFDMTGRGASPLVKPHEWTYIYRWGVSQLHLSAYGFQMQTVYDNVKAEPATIVINPKMHRDYASEITSILKSI